MRARVKFMFYQRNRGNKDSTIERRERYLKELVKQQGANLDDPETVKRAIHEIKWESNRSKNNAVLAYTLYLRMNGKTWEKPRARFGDLDTLTKQIERGTLQFIGDVQNFLSKHSAE